MFEMVKKLLEVSAEKGVDLFVAEDMLKTDFPQDAEAFAAAGDVIQKYYREITAFVREKDDDKLKELCTLVSNNDTEGLKLFIENVTDFVDKSFLKAKEANK